MTLCLTGLESQPLSEQVQDQQDFFTAIESGEYFVQILLRLCSSERLTPDRAYSALLSPVLGLNTCRVVQLVSKECATTLVPEN